MALQRLWRRFVMAVASMWHDRRSFVGHGVVGATLIAGYSPPLDCFAAGGTGSLTVEDPLRGFKMAEDARKAHAGNCKTRREPARFQIRKFCVFGHRANRKGEARQLPLPLPCHTVTVPVASCSLWHLAPVAGAWTVGRFGSGLRRWPVELDSRN
jgi:hypothetical protein